jgi:DNA-binding transcriptional LysR family regulator
MELGWLEDFLALVESGNFSRAAELRNLTQPAFSRRIKALEEWAGTPLFDRSTHRGGLTEAGEAFRPFATEIIRRVLESREAVRQKAGSEAATIRIAATHTLSQTFLPQWLRRLEAKAGAGGSFAMRLSSDTRAGAEQALRQGAVQFMLCHHHPAIPDRLEAGQFVFATIGTEQLVPVSLPDAEGKPLFALPGSAEKPLPVLAYNPESAFGWIAGALQARASPPAFLETALTAHVATVLLAMVQDGRGFAWLPESLVDEALAAGRLVRAGGSDWEAEMEVRLYRARARQSPAAETFWAGLKKT